jgi:RHS repeat-associated protein
VLIKPVTGQSCAWQFALTKLTLIMPDKGEIQFRDDVFDGEPQPAQTDGACLARDANRGTSWHATEGSGMVFVSDSGSLGVSYGDLSGTVITADGSRYHFVNVTYPGGIQSDNNIHNLARCDKITDRNGNFIQIAYPAQFKEVDFTDQLGRLTTIKRNADDPTNPSGPKVPLLITLPGYNGQARYIKVLQAQVNQLYRSDQATTLDVITGDFNVGIIDYTWPRPAIRLFSRSAGTLDAEIDTQNVVSQIVLPDGRSLGFKYNQFGEVAEIDTPFGGSIQYEYNTQFSSLPAGNTPSQEARAQLNTVTGIDRAVTEKRTYVGGVQEGRWTYVYNPQTPSNATTQSPCTEIVCTDVKNNKLLAHERHFYNPGFTYFNGPDLIGKDGDGYVVWSTGLEFRKEVFDSDGTTVLASNETDWHQRATIQWSANYTTAMQEPTPPGEQIENDNRITDTRQFLDDGSMSKVHTEFDDNGSSPRANNPIKIDEYDFGGVLKRHTEIVYVQTYWHNSIHLLRLVDHRSVYDVPNGTLFANTTFEYDNYTPEQQNPVHQALDDHSAITISGHDVTYDKTWTTRGNPTEITQFGGASPSPSTYPHYDILGNAVSTIDPNGNVTTVSFADDFGDGSNPGGGAVGTNGATFALPTLTTTPPPLPNQPQQTARSQYDFSTGLLTGLKDRNGTITQTFYNDPFNRPTLNKAAVGISGVETHTAFYYAPTTRFGITLSNDDTLSAKDQTSVDDATLLSWTHTDGFGRVIENWLHDSQSDIKTATGYDALSRKVTTSNPFRPSVDSEADTVTTFDMLGRITAVTTPDDATVSTYHYGNRSLVKDQASKERLSVMDALGRLTDVWEITSTDSGTYLSTSPISFPGHAEVTAGYHTSYSYDPMDDLTGVTQLKQRRTFTYDGLKRPLSVQCPESGLITYLYDNIGNLTQKTDPRANGTNHVQTNYAYDALNRLISRSCTVPTGITPQVGSTPTVTFTYDRTAQGDVVTNGIGRLTSVGSSVSTYTFDSFDGLGRVTQSTQTTGGTAYPQMTYTYDLAGEMLTEKYPSGTTIATAYDQSARISSVKQTAPVLKTYASPISYSPQGTVKSMTLGNGLIENTTFNTRLQPTEIQLGTSGVPGSKLDLTFTYNTQGKNDDNGNLLTESISANASSIASQTYTYDALNRLTSASETSAWSQAFNYDPYGNMWVTNPPTGINLNPLTATAQNDYNSVTNQLVSATYDSAGNQSTDRQGNSYFYDVDSHQTSCVVAGVAALYTYDGRGHRATKTIGAVVTVFVYDAYGKLIAEYGGQTSGSNLGTSYLTGDNLGSTRIVTRTDQSVVARHDYLPFGDEIPVGIGTRTVALGYVTSDDTRQKFTGKERDTESNLDYFGARYYSPPEGRFTSIDPQHGHGGLIDPQVWNLYIYVRNNPLSLNDPDGRADNGNGGNKVIDIFITLNADDFRKSNRYTNFSPLQSFGKQHGYTINVFYREESTFQKISESLQKSELTLIDGHSVHDKNPHNVWGMQLVDRDWDMKGVLAQINHGDFFLMPRANVRVLGLFGCDTIHMQVPVIPNKDDMFVIRINSRGDAETSVPGMTAAMQAFVRTYIETKGNLVAAVNAGNRVLAIADTTASGVNNKGDRLVLTEVQPGIYVNVTPPKSPQDEEESRALDPQQVYNDLGGLAPRDSRPPNR